MRFLFCFLAISLTCISFAGCGAAHPRVSGVIALEGQPLENIEVIFAPHPNKDSGNAGRPSSAVTDANGWYSLKTTDGKSGALVGSHSVKFRWFDVSEGCLKSLKMMMGEARDNPERLAEIQQQIAEIEQKLDSRPSLPTNITATFTVPASGTSEANFELSDLNQDE